jgi:carboxypeptidase C (cathepsin A)
LKNLDLNSLISEVSELNLNFNFYESNAKSMCENFLDQLLNLQNKYLIKKSLRLRNKSDVKWLSNDVKSVMNRRDFLKKKFNKLKSNGFIDNSLYNEYKYMKNNVVKLIRKSKRILIIDRELRNQCLGCNKSSHSDKKQ